MTRAIRFLIPGLMLAAAASLADDNAFAVTNVTVIPMDRERVLEGQTLVVRDGSIAELGETASMRLPAELRQIDGSGKFLVPGLMDLHAHLRHSDELSNYASWGVTTVMHLGGSGLSGAGILELREDIRGGERFGPRVFATNRVLDGAPRLNDSFIEITDTDTARAEVRKLKEQGFDFVKIYNNIARPEFEAVVAEARVQGLAVVGHIPRKFPALDALSSGQNAIAHAEELFFTHFEGPRSTDDSMDRRYAPDMSKLPPLVRALTEHDVAVMPNLCFTFTNQLMWDDLDLLWNDPEYSYLHPATASMWEQSNINRRPHIQNFMLRSRVKYELMLQLTRAFEDAGILQVAGTDASLPGLFPGKSLHRELTELIKAGLTNYEALAVATRNGGEFIRRLIDPELRVGQIRPGYRADFVLLNDNPLADIRNARKIAGVALDGRYADRESLDGRRATLRARYDKLRRISNAVDERLQEADDADTLLDALLRKFAGDQESLDMIEARINAAGYGAAYAGDMTNAVELLRMNTELFPNSANTWSSLAEIVLYQGQEADALRYYRRALEADPQLDSAADQIRRMEADDSRNSKGENLR